MIDRAIERGVSAGFRRSLAAQCDGYHDPEDRCEMRPRDGCACRLVRWERLPWWRRCITPRPPEPSDDAVLDALIRLRVDDVVRSEIPF